MVSPVRVRAVLLSLALVPSALAAQRTVTPEAKVFREYRDGVFTVFSDRGRGSGFLIDASGLVLTNQHVVSDSEDLAVQINDSLKVRATVLAVDEVNDVAVIYVNPEVVQGRPVLPLAPTRDELAFEGERVVAIGSPLNQTKILTSGIVSKVEANAIISDVNINHGNSGGPLLNMDGEVVAINTFGDFTSQGGPGISGSISIYLAEPTIRRARTEVSTAAPPPAERLPVMPRDIFPLSALQAAATAERWNTKFYDISALTNTGGFSVQVFTPPVLYRMEKAQELALAEARNQKTGQQSGEGSGYSPFEDLKSWGQYIGEYAPVVLVQVSPKLGETTGSKWANALGAFSAGLNGTGYYGSHKMEFKADLGNITLRRDGELVEPIQRGMVMVPMQINTADYYARYYGKDLAQAGVLQLPVDLFEPNADGSWPVIQVECTDLRKPGEPVAFVVPRATVEEIWFDFEPYREQRAADTIPFNPSDGK